MARTKVRLHWANNYGPPVAKPVAKPKPVPAVQHARQVTAAAFAKGQVPAPYYLFLLARANARGLTHGQAMAVGCANPAKAGGTVYVQRTCAQYKGPTATRRQWGTRLVPNPRYTPSNGQQPFIPVTVRKVVTVVA